VPRVGQVFWLYMLSVRYFSEIPFGFFYPSENYSGDMQ
jgi:hypothetical protein